MRIPYPRIPVARKLIHLIEMTNTTDKTDLLKQFVTS